MHSGKGEGLKNLHEKPGSKTGVENVPSIVSFLSTGEQTQIFDLSGRLLVRILAAFISRPEPLADLDHASIYHPPPSGIQAMAKTKKKSKKEQKFTERGLIVNEAGAKRCWWCGNDPLYQDYHDNEWGRPVYDDQRLFEKICLEGFQAGLSWITILRKRENFRKAFRQFDFNLVALMTERDVTRLLTNEGIVRHCGKIESTIHNAAKAIELVASEGSLSNYFWSFEPKKKVTPRCKEDIPSITAESTALSKDLKKRGWSFVGPTTCYAFMQAMGLVNDHIGGCDFRD